jgi:choline dehydrogenase-like flavoprotein
LAAKNADRDYYNYAMAVLLILQDMPVETNRVDLDPDVRDAWGLQVARITHKPHSNDVKMANWQMRKNVEILEAAGATSIVTTQLEQGASTTFHQHGTARMGKDPNKAVLNEWCRAHDVTNLYVLDGSCFPTATGVPPTLAIMANAWRCAEHMLQVDAKGRN